MFSSFLSDHIITPEVSECISLSDHHADVAQSHGLLLTYYFPETARHRLLREVAVRAQQLASDDAYKWWIQLEGDFLTIVADLWPGTMPKKATPNFEMT